MRVGIAGVGLIGGSLALALRERHEVRVYDVAAAARDRAAERGLRVVARLAELAPADAIVVATPLAAVVPTLDALAPVAGGAVLVDVGSVRGPIDAYVRERGAGPRVVGMHPMAGRTATGLDAADPALLRDRPVLVVPTVASDDAAMRVAGTLARDAGGVVTVCSATVHDRVVAAVSALPLAVAAALTVAAADDEIPLSVVAGTGFRDATRLALTADELALPLLATNAAHVVAALARLRAVLDEIERAVAERDVEGLRELLAQARAARDPLG